MMDITKTLLNLSLALGGVAMIAGFVTAYVETQDNHLTDWIKMVF